MTNNQCSIYEAFINRGADHLTASSICVAASRLQYPQSGVSLDEVIKEAKHVRKKIERIKKSKNYEKFDEGQSDQTEQDVSDDMGQEYTSVGECIQGEINEGVDPVEAKISCNKIFGISNQKTASSIIRGAAVVDRMDTINNWKNYGLRNSDIPSSRVKSASSDNYLKQMLLFNMRYDGILNGTWHNPTTIETPQSSNLKSAAVEDPRPAWMKVMGIY